MGKCSGGGMVDTKDLKSFALIRRAGSSPAPSTIVARRLRCFRPEASGLQLLHLRSSQNPICPEFKLVD